jgi:hypothetical protein
LKKASQGGCPLATSQVLYGNTPVDEGDAVYADFDDAFNFINGELNANGKLLCPIYFQSFSAALPNATTVTDGMVCRGGELELSESDGVKQIVCNKNYEDFHASMYVVEYEENGALFMDTTYHFVDANTGNADVSRSVDNQILKISRLPSTW